MPSLESRAPAERCAACPNRDKLSRLLAKIGLTEVGTCPGPDVVDRFAATAGERAGEMVIPAGFAYVGSQGNETTTTDFFRSPADRTDVCRDDTIVIAADETVTKAESNDDGRIWVRIGRGDPEAVRGADFDLDLDAAGPSTGMSPLEVLKAARPQTVTDERGPQE